MSIASSKYFGYIGYAIAIMGGWSYNLFTKIGG